MIEQQENVQTVQKEHGEVNVRTNVGKDVTILRAIVQHAIPKQVNAHVRKGIMEQVVIRNADADAIQLKLIALNIQEAVLTVY